MAGTWTEQTHSSGAQPNTMLLLTDGSVIATDSHGGWYKLTPDSTGGYINGTWSKVASSAYSRLYFASVVMNDGRVFVGGGEYGNGGNTIEIYDPVKNTWTKVTSWKGGYIKDSSAKMLPNGDVLLESGYDYSYIWNPNTDTWTTTAKKYYADSYSEESSELLPGGRILNVVNGGTDINHSEIYDASSNTWIEGDNTGVKLSDGEIGPGVLLYNGAVVQFGAKGASAIYNPSTNIWKAGPTTPLAANKYPIQFDDAPAAVLPNGNVLLIGDSGGYNGPGYALVFSPTTNSFSIVSGPPDPLFPVLGAYNYRLLVLPTGQILLSDGLSAMGFVYTPDGTPIASAAPKIISVTRNSDTSYTLTGTQLNGSTEGAYYGDDAQMATNYPIVRLKSSTGRIYYGRTYDFSTMSLATGSAHVTTKFVIPEAAPTGTYSLEVIANGIASAPVAVSLEPSTTAFYR